MLSVEAANSNFLPVSRIEIWRQEETSKCDRRESTGMERVYRMWKANRRTVVIGRRWRRGRRIWPGSSPANVTRGLRFRSNSDNLAGDGRQ